MVTYDRSDRVIIAAQPGGQQSVSYSYDKVGNRTSVTATNATTNYAVNYGYDADNRLKFVTATNQTTEFFYDYNSNRTKMHLPNNIWVDYSYDKLNRLKAIDQYLGSNSTPFAFYHYELAPNGNRTIMTDSVGTTNWEYDDAYRLIRENRQAGANTWDLRFSYDKTGNRITQKIDSNPVVTSTYNQLDQLTNDGTQNYYYDPRGNLIKITNGTSYGYDAADRMITATVGGSSAIFGYDQDGRRITQTIGVTTTRYLWDETSPYGDVALETDGSNNIQVSYVLGGSELIGQQRSGGLGYYLKDGQGSVRALTNGSGTVTDNYLYNAFGELKSSTGSTPNIYRYTGQQFDSLTGLYDLRARYYNPQQGRFLSRDIYPVNSINPIEINRYGYTSNNPINFIDPAGYEAIAEQQSISSKISIAVRQSLAALGRSSLRLLSTITAKLSVEGAKQLVRIAQQAIATTGVIATIKGARNFTVAIARAVHDWSFVETIIAISDYRDPWLWFFYATVQAALRPFAVTVIGGNWGGGDHAETILVRYLRNNSANFYSPQDIPGAVSKRVCGYCSGGADGLGLGPGWTVVYNIDQPRDIKLVLAFVGYDPPQRP